jgi:hypothetical protein
MHQDKYCCSRFERGIREKNERTEGKSIFYDPPRRAYMILAKKYRSAKMVIEYCPFCGKKLPKLLYDEYWETLAKEHGEEYYVNCDKKPPKEFRTDEWWKKRGL